METKARSIFLAMLLTAVLSSSLSAASDGYTVVNGPKNFYYGHVSNIDAQEGPEPYILRENGTQRIPAILNMPLMPGDTIVAPGAGRLEIQFDNGTILRLDAATEMKIETILAETLTTRNMMTNLVLSRGQVYTMFKEYSPREICQFLLPTAAVRLRHQTVAILGVGEEQASDVRVRRGRADVLYGPDAKALKKHDVLKGERITIGPDHRYALQSFPEGMPFESWNNSQNDSFELLHKGLSVLPKPVRRWPLAVQYFAEKYGNLYGEWIYDAYLGYVWRPADNDRPYAGGWHPYFSGQWTTAENQMYWVPSEPWGWIPYHLGAWRWDKKRGWFWVPGSAFSPAGGDGVYYASFLDWFDLDPYHKNWGMIAAHWQKKDKVSRDQLEESKTLLSKPADLNSPRAVPPARSREATPRIRDWNPDVKTALEYGVSIRYDSGSNQVYSPELHLRSGDVWSLLDRWGNRGEMGGSRFAGSLEPGNSGSFNRSSDTDSQTGITSAGDRSAGSSSGGAEKK